MVTLGQGPSVRPHVEMLEPSWQVRPRETLRGDSRASVSIKTRPMNGSSRHPLTGKVSRLGPLVLGEADVRELLPMGECIDLMSAVMKALAESTAVQPLRSMFVVKGEPGFLALMPAMLGDPRVLGVKVLSIFPRNEGGPKSAHQGAVLLFDRDDGRPLAFVDETSTTEIRTAATSAVATRALAREDCSTLAVLG